MRKFGWLVWIFMTQVLWGCAGLAQPSASPVTPVHQTYQETAALTLTKQPILATTAVNFEPATTPMFESSLVTQPAVTATKQPTVTRGIIPVCQGKGQITVPSATFGFDGTIVYQAGIFDGLYTIGGVPLRQSRLPADQTKKFDVYGFSPNGKWLAYSPVPPIAFESGFVLNSFDIVLVSDEREQLINTMDVRNFGDDLPRHLQAHLEAPVSTSWINDQLLYTNLAAKTEQKTEYTGYYIYSPKVLNPFTGEWISEVMSNLPDSGVASIAFSSDLTRALYYTPPAHLVLLDLSTGKVLWEDKKFLTSVGAMVTKWAPDDNMVLVANRTSSAPQTIKVSLANRDGRLLRTIASDSYPTDHFSPLGIAWSPNARYIAMTQLGIPRDQVYIYDVEQDAYLFGCPASGHYLVWSPDSKYLAIGGENASLRVLEIKTGEITEIAPYGIPVGWSTSFPTDWP